MPPSPSASVDFLERLPGTDFNSPTTRAPTIRAGVGIYNLSGGLLQATGPTGYGGEYIGLTQHGTVNQTNGSNIATTLTFGANGRYNLNGGLLQTNLLQGGSTFYFNAGTLQAGPGGLSNCVPIAVGVPPPMWRRSMPMAKPLGSMATPPTTETRRGTP